MMTQVRNLADVITIVRDYDHALGKRFHLEDDGTIRKQATVAVACGRAVMRHVPTHESLQAVLTEVGDDPHAAVINAGFHGVDFDEPFVLLSERMLAHNRLDTRREALVGVHRRKITRAVAGFSVGEHIKAMGRFKENVYASSWQILDRDLDEYTPPQYRSLDQIEWLTEVDRLLPGLLDAERTTTRSTSARVFRDGVAVGSGNGHTWIKIRDANDVERTRTAMTMRAVDQGLTWKKPRISKNSGEVCGHSVTTAVDTSTWVTGRLIFCGKPCVSAGLEVRPQVIDYAPGGPLDTSRAVMPSADRVRKQTRAAGCELRVRRDGSRLVLDAYNLHLDTELETASHGILTVEAALALQDPKVRCQAPFRQSSSLAAFLARAQDGRPFVHDVGTGTNHWLCDEDVARGAFGTVDVVADDIINELRGLDRQAVITSWANKSVTLSPADTEAVIDEVTRRTGVGLHALRAELKLQRDDLQREKCERRLRERAGQREQVTFDPTNKYQVALAIDRLIAQHFAAEQYCIFASMPAEVCVRELPFTHIVDRQTPSPPNVPTIRPLDRVAMLLRVEAVAQLVTAESKPAEMAVPQSILDVLLNKREHTAPTARGLVSHPFVDPSGDIVATNGLHPKSGLLVVGGAVSGGRPYSQDEAKAAVQRLALELLEGFEFADDLDAVAALAMLLTGVQRKVLDIAPGFLVEATSQSTGKTTLARIVVVTLTGHDLAATAFPADEAEVQKLALTLLMASPAAIVLDNLADGLTSRSSTLALLLTAGMFRGRLLGASKEIEVPTNTLLVATANNPRLGLDEATRWLPVRLEARTARPERRVFRHPDVVCRVLTLRDQVLRDVVGIVAGYIQNGSNIAVATRFPSWDRMVRQPLIWAGAGDVAEAFNRNAANSEEIGAHGSLIRMLRAEFGCGRFRAGDVITLIERAGFSDRDELPELLAALRVRNVASAKSVGWALSRLDRRRVVLDDVECWLEAVADGHGHTHYQVRSAA